MATYFPAELWLATALQGPIDEDRKGKASELAGKMAGGGGKWKIKTREKLKISFVSVILYIHIGTGTVGVVFAGTRM